jgi:hypothetical protein
MLENLKRGSTCMAIASIITQFNTFYSQATFQRKLLPDYPIYTHHGKAYGVWWELEKFISR